MLDRTSQVPSIAGTRQDEFSGGRVAVCLDSVPGTGRGVCRHPGLSWLHPENPQQPPGARGRSGYEVSGKIMKCTKVNEILY